MTSELIRKASIEELCGHRNRANEAYETERSHHDANSALVRLADFVAGKTAEKEAAK